MKIPSEEARKKVLEHDKEFAFRKPPVPGEAVEYIFIPAMGFMLGRLVKEGQVIRIIDLEGQQVADTILWDAGDFYNVSNCWMTMILNRKWDKYRPGDAIYSRNCERMAMISEDTTDGTHAFAGAFCNEQLNYVRYGIPGTINCHDNFLAAMKNYGFTADDIDWGSCHTFFMYNGFSPDGSLVIREPRTKAGDYIDLTAEMDIIVAISACPSRRNPCNAYNPSPMQAVIFNPDKDYKAKVDALSDERQAAYPLY